MTPGIQAVHKQLNENACYWWLDLGGLQSNGGLGQCKSRNYPRRSVGSEGGNWDSSDACVGSPDALCETLLSYDTL